VKNEILLIYDNNQAFSTIKVDGGRVIYFIE
jgi:hypothetical protein